MANNTAFMFNQYMSANHLLLLYHTIKGTTHLAVYPVEQQTRIHYYKPVSEMSEYEGFGVGVHMSL